MSATAVVLIAHGTVRKLEDLPRFLANIRRGHEAPPELVAEVRRRYEAIGGASPLLDVTEQAARKLEARLGLPTRVAMRLFEPYPREVVARLAAEGARRIVTVPLAQHSAAIYGAAVRAAAAEVDPSLEVLCAKNWGRTRELTQAFADAIAVELAAAPAGEPAALVLTAHSLPVAVVRAGDPYEAEVRASAADVVAALRARGAPFSQHAVAFQSQGIGAGTEWLGPDLRQTLETLAAQRARRVVVAPIGFLADHVEILYDLDIEARGWCAELGLELRRSASLNASDTLVEALARVVGGVLASPESHAATAPGAPRAR